MLALLGEVEVVTGCEQHSTHILPCCFVSGKKLSWTQKSTVKKMTCLVKYYLSQIVFTASFKHVKENTKQKTEVTAKPLRESQQGSSPQIKSPPLWAAVSSLRLRARWTSLPASGLTWKQAKETQGTNTHVQHTALRLYAQVFRQFWKQPLRFCSVSTNQGCKQI